ncbi:hypothetical protein [Actinorugispora endophytica]|uniref:Uncharacterized protein n=1 Tax=Actinorugispora endophytica TaxID=1605990 RepID=A0A4R6UZU6_9ACTN|nr:hypothetical protein [Actinorugispora endophytica]TDQ53146.1 hypothetical protein EV190_105268 [Actinorugispora endophytica]
MPTTVTHGDLLDTTGQDARLASLIRQLADIRPEITLGWTPPPAPQPHPVPVPAATTPPAPSTPPARRPHPLPFPRVLHPLDPHPVTGRRPTREDFPVPDDLAEFLTRLRPDAAKRRKPRRHYRPLHATPDHYARERRPGLLRRAARLLGSLLGGAR